METKEQVKQELSKPRAIDTVRTMLEKCKGQLQAAAPRAMNLDRVVRLSLTTLGRNPRLLECHPATLIGAIIQVTQLGLDLDSATNQVHLVPFKNNKKNRMEVQIIIGYKGLETLAMRTGLVKRIVPFAVHEGDDFSYQYGMNPKLEHTPLGKSPNLTHVYAMVHYVNGDKEFRVLTREQVEKRRARSMAANNGPWVTDYEAMALKSAIRDVCKWTPNANPDVENLHRAISLDEKAEISLPQDLGLLSEPETEEPTAPEPSEPVKIEAPAMESKSELTLSQRWAEVQNTAIMAGIKTELLLKTANAKEVTNANINQLEAVLNEMVEQQKTAGV